MLIEDPPRFSGNPTDFGEWVSSFLVYAINNDFSQSIQQSESDPGLFLDPKCPRDLAHASEVHLQLERNPNSDEDKAMIAAKEKMHAWLINNKAMQALEQAIPAAILSPLKSPHGDLAGTIMTKLHQKYLPQP